MLWQERIEKPSTRRQFLGGLVAGGSALGSGWSGCAAVQASEADALQAARRQAVNRRRRVIYNNDGDDIWTSGADTQQKFLNVRHTPLLNTHVDSISYCTTQSFNHFTHDTRVAEMFKSRSGQFADNNLQRFLNRHTDGLRMSVEFAHQHGMESLWTLRMNDIHDAWTPAFLSKWKQQNAQRIMSSLAATRKFNDRRRLWSLVDFEHPDVEPRLVEIVEEVLDNYDVDGVELDFMRAPFYFRTSYLGQPATSNQVAILSRLVRRIRKSVLDRSQKRGKPLLLSVRVPSTVALCRKIGIDIKAWLQESLVDLLVVGGGYLTFGVRVSELVELGHKHRVPVYPCASQSGLYYRPPRGKGDKQPVEAWCGVASQFYDQGADGICTFNLFPGPGTADDRAYARNVLNRIGSAESLRRSPILYAVSDAGQWMPAHYWAKDATDYSGALPLELKPGEFTRTEMIVSEDLRGADLGVTAELRMDFSGLQEDARPVILFGSANFGPRSDGKQVAGVRRFVCPVPVQAVTQGRNRVMAKVSHSGAKIAGAELWIRR
ncbi:MAG: hypothetical protein ABGZ17_17840 [Planctomycetaceae bacterium]